MFMNHITGTAMKMPETPYPYNHRMPVQMQRLHWVMSHLNKEARPKIVAIVRKLSNPYMLKEHKFIMAVPTSDPDLEIAYFCEGQMSQEFSQVLPIIQQGH